MATVLVLVNTSYKNRFIDVKASAKKQLFSCQFTIIWLIFVS